MSRLNILLKHTRLTQPQFPCKIANRLWNTMTPPRTVLSFVLWFWHLTTFGFPKRHCVLILTWARAVLWRHKLMSTSPRESVHFEREWERERELLWVKGECVGGHEDQGKLRQRFWYRSRKACRVTGVPENSQLRRAETECMTMIEQSFQSQASDCSNQNPIETVWWKSFA